MLAKHLKWAPQMWVPILVYVIYAFGILRPLYLDFSWILESQAGIVLSVLFVFAQLVIVFGIPVAILICLVPIKCMRWALLVAFPLIMMAIFLGLLASGLSNNPADAVRAIVLTSCITASMVYVAECLRKHDPLGSLLAKLSLLTIAVCATWSLISYGALYISANQTAEAADFQVVLGGPDGYEDVQSWLDLRGVDLGVASSTTISYGSNLTFYAVLCIEDSNNLWNWSKRRMQFELIEQPELAPYPINCEV